jgi:hypothetical protein
MYVYGYGGGGPQIPTSQIEMMSYVTAPVELGASQVSPGDPKYKP